MTRRIVLAAMGVLVAAAAGCQTLNFSTPTSTPNYQAPAQLSSGGTAVNPVASTSPAPAASTTPATPATPATSDAAATPASPAAK
jgi:hypothetical protein